MRKNLASGRFSAASFMLLLLLITPATESYAQAEAGAVSLGLGVKGILPTGSFSRDNVYGLGFGIINEAKLSQNMSLGGELCWYHVDTESGTTADQNTDADNVQFLGVQAGVKYHGGQIFVGVDGGYFWGSDLDNELDILLVAGFQAKEMDITLQYNILGDVNWIAVRVGYFIFKF